MKLRLLDLFCGAGGAARGYADAGFEVVGIDINSQPHYPFEFIQADALTFPFDGFDVIHASPPCQHYSPFCTSVWKDRTYPDLVEIVRHCLQYSGKPFVIENVVHAPLPGAIVLCGSMFGLHLKRHRLFESNYLLFAPGPCKHVSKPAKVWGHCVVPEAQKAMGIHWMNQKEISQAIPPAYTCWIGQQLMAVMESEVA